MCQSYSKPKVGRFLRHGIVRCWNADPTPNPYTTNLKEVLTILHRYLRQRCTNFDANSIRRIQFIVHLLIIWPWLSPFNPKKQQRVSYSQWLILHQVWSQRIYFLLMLGIDIRIHRKQTHSQAAMIALYLTGGSRVVVIQELSSSWDGRPWPQ